MNDPVAALAAFVKGELSPESLVEALRPSVVFAQEADGAIRVDYVGAPIAHVTFTRSDVVRALDRAIAGQMSVEELSRWASLVTLLDFFDLESTEDDSDAVWDTLDLIAHPEQSGFDDSWRLRELRERL
jgi:hypothetical protein